MDRLEEYKRRLASHKWDFQWDKWSLEGEGHLHNSIWLIKTQPNVDPGGVLYKAAKAEYYARFK